jgi:peptide/nickel transport system permease protein
VSAAVAAVGTRAQSVWRVAERGGFRWALVGGVVFLLVAIFGPLVWPDDPSSVNLDNALLAPSLDHPMGTDEYGRDVLARFLVGMRISLALGVASVVVAAAVGLVLGAVSGFLGGVPDQLIGRGQDAVLAFPALVMGMGVALAIGPGALAAGLAVTITGIPWYARVVRSEVLSLKTREFVEAERALGASRRHILMNHIMPSMVGGVAVQASLGIAYAVLAIAGLGFLGLGVQPPTPEWGAMITEGRQYLASGQWWISIFPGFGILILVTLSIAIGEALRDYWDPHGKLHF